MTAESAPIAEAHYIARKDENEEFRSLDLAIYAPRPAEPDGEFKGMWLCKGTLSGVVNYSESFPGMDSLQALEFAQVMVAGYLAHLSTEYEVTRRNESGKAIRIPLFAHSLLASILQGRLENPLG